MILSRLKFPASYIQRCVKCVISITVKLYSHKIGSCFVTMCTCCVFPKPLYGNTKLSRTYTGGTSVFENVLSEG